MSARSFDRLIRGMTRFTKDVTDSFEDAMLAEVAEEIFPETQRQVPKDTETLADSGTVTSQRRKNGVHAAIVYDNPYALAVHEIPPQRAHHDAPTKWKYLEDPLKEAGKGMISRVRSRMRKEVLR